MKGQLLIAQLAVLLEQRAAQDALRRQALPSGLLDPVPAQVPCDQAEQLAVVVQSLRHRLQLTADLVPGEQIEYAAPGPCVLGALSAPAVVGCALASVA
jgi:hypothetical protein